MPPAKSSLPGKTYGPGQFQGMAQPRNQRLEEEVKKLHWEEEVIRPVIFGNNYDPLQEVILNGGGGAGWEGRGLSVGGDCVCREVAVEVCAPATVASHPPRGFALPGTWVSQEHSWQLL